MTLAETGDKRGTPAKAYGVWTRKPDRARKGSVENSSPTNRAPSPASQEEQVGRLPGKRPSATEGPTA